MKMYNNGRRGFFRNSHGRKAILAAISSLGIAASFAQAQTAATVYFDNNGNTSGLGSGTGTWNGTNINWATTTAGTSDISWVPGNVAGFDATITTVVSGVQSVSGLYFAAGGNSGTTPNLIAANSSAALNFGTNNFNITNATNTKQIIAVPIQGSGTMTIVGNAGATTGTAPVDLVGNLSGFSGNIIVNNAAAATLNNANGNVLQLDVPPSNSAATIYLDAGVGLEGNNPVGYPSGTVTFTGSKSTASGTSPGSPGDPFTGMSGVTPMMNTIANPIVLNYNALAGPTGGTTNVIGQANGGNVIENNGGTVTTVSYQKVMVYSGVISSPSSVTTNLEVSGSRGTTIMAGANTYNGNTIVATANTNGMLVFGADNTLPSTTNLLIGTGTNSSVGPIDLDGHNQTFASLNNVNNKTTGATAIGNIYNLSFSGIDSAYAPYANQPQRSASITLTPVNGSNTTYMGDIGDTNLSIPPLQGVLGSGNYPYDVSGVGQTALTNINLTLNGPSGGVGTNSLTLNPIANLTSGNEYSGTTTVNSNAVLVLGRVTAGAPDGAHYTVSGNGNVTINNGGVLASSPTGTGSFTGGFGGTVEMKSGSMLNIGGIGGIGTLNTGNMVVDGGSTLNFDFGSNSGLYDQLALNGGLTIDKTSNSVLNLGEVAGVSFITPGAYNLITATGGISTSGSGTGSLLFANGTTNETIGPEQLTLSYNTSNVVQVIVSANAVQWDGDPSGGGAAAVNSGGKVTEGGGIWADGGTTGTGDNEFVDYSHSPFTEYVWSNAAARDVIIGNDPTQAGADVAGGTGSITLGSNITVGKLTFGAIGAGYPYQIADNGSGFGLTINGGLSVNNNAVTPTTTGNNSGEIDVPITLGASQTWEVDPGQFLDIKGTVSGAGLTMTKTGSGVVDFEGANGSLATLNAQAGIVLLGSVSGLGNATFNLDGGAVQYGATGTSNNPINVTANGGSLGTTTGFTATVTSNITPVGTFSAIGTGTTILTGTVSAATFNDVGGSTGVMAFAGPTNIGTFNSKSGIAALAGTSAISVGTINSTGGYTVFDNDNPATSVGTILLTGGTLQIGNGDAHGSIDQGTLLLLGIGTTAASGTIAFDRSDNWTFTNPISGGSLSLQQNGGGTVTVAESNSTTYGTTGTGINNGTIALGVDNPLGEGTMLITGPSSGIAALNLSGHTQIVQGLRTPTGTLNVNSSNELITNDSANVGTLIINNTGAAEFDGNINGNINLFHGDGIHTGINNETLGGNVSVNSITLYAGTLQIGAGTTTGSIGSVPVTALGAATLAFDRSDTVTYLTPLSSASLTVAQSGPGTTNIGVSNSYAGGNIITDGTLQLGATGALGLGTMTIGSGTNSTGSSTFDLNGFNQRVLVVKDGGTAGFGNEMITNAASTPSLLSMASGTGTFSGVISGNISILHDGSGFQGLEGSNTFNGSVSVSAGTISANTWNAPNTPGPLGEQSDGIGAVTLGGPGTTGILENTGTVSFTLPRPISVVGGGVGGLRLTQTLNLTIPAGSISGAGGFEKLGSGTFTIVGTELFHGPASIIRNAEDVDTVADIGQPSAFGYGDADANSATITLGDGATDSSTISFNSSTPQETNRPIRQNELGASQMTIVAGDISVGAGAVTSSNLTLTGGIDVSNSVSVTGGTVVFGGAGMITVATNPISGALGRVYEGVGTANEPTVNGTGTLVLSANNTYGGGTYIRNGVVVVSSDSNLGAAGGSLNFTGVAGDTGTLLLTGAVNGTRPINVTGDPTAVAAIDVGANNGTFGAVTGTAPLSKYGSGNLGVASVRTSALNINAGTVSNVSARSMSATSDVTALNIAGGSGAWTAAMDLGSNDMIVDYTGSSPLATIQDQVRSGYHGGSWTGTGITSAAALAAAASGHPTAIAYGEASSVLGSSGGTFDGLSVDGTAVLLRYTYSGDANMDGTVNALDFNAFATNYGVNNGSEVWTQGDFNYDGTVNSSDFAILAANYGQVMATSAALPSALPADALGVESLGTMVPEPGSLSLVALLGAVMVRRRRRHA